MSLNTVVSARSAAPGCRPGGCAGLCSSAGLAAADRAYRSLLLARARAVLHDRQLAEDAVQETFERAWRACATYDPSGPPLRSWLCVIGRNVALDLARTRMRHPSVPSEALDQQDTVPADRGVNEVDALVLRLDLVTALSRLDTEHRTAVVETILRDRPGVDVAAEIGIPHGTLRSRTHYALRQLRTMDLVA